MHFCAAARFEYATLRPQAMLATFEQAIDYKKNEKDAKKGGAPNVREDAWHLITSSQCLASISLQVHAE
jgi:hypothetical protein